MSAWLNRTHRGRQRPSRTDELPPYERDQARPTHSTLLGYQLGKSVPTEGGSLDRADCRIRALLGAQAVHTGREQSANRRWHCARPSTSASMRPSARRKAARHRTSHDPAARVNVQARRQGRSGASPFLPASVAAGEVLGVSATPTSRVERRTGRAGRRPARGSDGRLRRSHTYSIRSSSSGSAQCRSSTTRTRGRSAARVSNSRRNAHAVSSGEPRAAPRRRPDAGADLLTVRFTDQHRSSDIWTLIDLELVQGFDERRVGDSLAVRETPTPR